MRKGLVPNETVPKGIWICSCAIIIDVGLPHANALLQMMNDGTCIHGERVTVQEPSAVHDTPDGNSVRFDHVGNKVNIDKYTYKIVMIKWGTTYVSKSLFFIVKYVPVPPAELPVKKSSWLDKRSCLSESSCMTSLRICLPIKVNPSEFLTEAVPDQESLEQ